MCLLACVGKRRLFKYHSVILGTLSTFARKSKLKIIDLEAILQNDRLPSPSSSQSEPKKEKPNKGEDHVQTAACVIEAYNKRDQSSNAGKSLPWNSDVINELASDLKDIIDFNSKRSLSGSLETLTDFMAGEEEMKLDVEAELPSDQVSKVDDSQGESLVDTPGESTIEDESPIRNDVFSLQDTDAYQNGHVDLKISTDSQDQKEEIFNISESQSSDGLPDSSNIKDLRNSKLMIIQI
ncbi:hypothetical protein RF11_10417 [Thelohanellus kitauei]|uniref:Uncharacterized protein n=1 Tax=Thelohanellus kitauei TaxID=669202 RepID=A0A0C2JB96_THEKT|nr:hypothetical protein RF11_10417 [Thelohanellus kitauei]